MGLAAFQRMRLRQEDKYKPENIKKEQEAKLEKPIPQETEIKPEKKPILQEENKAKKKAKKVHE